MLFFQCFFVFCMLCAMTGVAAEPAILPRPQKIVAAPGGTVLRSESGTICADDSAAAVAIAELLRSELGRPPVAIRFAADAKLAPEAYRLTADSAGVLINAADYAGFFNGSRTLLQLLRQAPGGTLTPMTIEDSPRFGWRGVMLDVARHYFPPKFLYQLVDQLAMIKMNVLHLHLTDDRGWRIEIKRYPLLTAKGAWRPGVDFGLDPASTTQYREDGQYGGFYTQEELKKLVAYAAKRNISIVPEIDIPGHSTVAIANYPELLKCDIRDGSNVYCAARESSYEFIENVLSEVFAIFPSSYIVLGGDEVRGKYWDSCPLCQKLSAEKGFKNSHELQHYFVNRIADFCRKQHRKPTGWDEIILGSSTIPEITVMTRFDGDEPGVKPAEAGREMIIMKTSKCYFDYAQGLGEPLSIGVRSTWEETYRLKPVPETMAADKQRFILGVEGALWTEYVPNEGHAGYLLFPRTLALAEVGWTGSDRLDEADFRNRLQTYLPALDEAGVSYRPDGGLLRLVERDGQVEISTPVSGAAIHLTLDGSYPTKSSPVYTGPMKIDGLTNFRIAVIGRQGNLFPVFNRTAGLGKWTVRGPEATADHPFDLALDDDINSFYQSKGPFAKDSEVRLDFDAPKTLSGIKVVAARGIYGGRSHFIRTGRLLTSADGEKFAEAAKFTNGVAEFKGPAKTVMAIRIIADEPVEPALRIREIFLYR